MTTILAVAAPAGAPGAVGTAALILILLSVTVGLVLIVRTLMVRLFNRVTSSADKGVGASHGDRGDERLEKRREEGPPAVMSGRALKAQYLRGEISKAEFDERLRELQISEYLEDSE